MTREREARRGVILWFTFDAVAIAVSAVQVLQGRDARQLAIVPVIVTLAGCANVYWLRRLKAGRAHHGPM